MPVSLQQTAAGVKSVSGVKSIHLLRALLREASYLPDETARHYFRRYLVSRFKAYQPKQNATASFDVEAVEKYRHQSFRRRHVGIINERAHRLQRKGHKGLNYLRRANLGEQPCLQKVLHFAYGRLGRRKHVLLDALLKPDPFMQGSNETALPDFTGPTPLQKLYYSDKRYLQYFDAPKLSKANHVISISDRYSCLRTVLQSQHQKGLGLHRDLKGAAFKTPVHNIWHRPMPIKRARNNVKRWYAETMERLLPPLPNEEWDNMHAMVTGEKWISFTKPRTPGVELNPSPVQDVDLFKKIIHEGLALDKLSRADRPAGINRPHTINPKFMRRLYSKILALCCKLDYDHERGRWIATWGEPIQRDTLKTYPVDESLFAGVDATGHVPKEKKKNTPDMGDAPKVAYIQPRNDKGEYLRFPFFTEFLPPNNPLRKELDEWKRKRAAAAVAESGKASSKR
ncbi:hypothetical protein P153DRAFT_432650 [Dothidotthia symphoricarpi CBS 119687]|uniref:LYR motif-containing protein Cup1-like N-terminal domain-containing protein n=1 Tax=Dothidotthia symphoricarpi CBS 119687 TaxID=1392245 RepID=A0A6A6A7G9_9PLEO|nr:uncharacterized protein P153DRAFT_432650 [Dothidotthia symphoricarpi CBS 119687]KAF2127526.1 hypothetical protein P153DRAFT_432650 [Dothidotthia symphoricarpi CBS 119687]